MSRWCASHFTLVALSLMLAARGAEVRVTGSDLLGSPLRAALEKYGRENDARLVLQLDGSRPGLDRLRSGDADLGLIVQAPGDAPSADSLVARTIAYQPVVFIVPERLPFKQITAAQVRGIFAATGGENYTNWGEVGLTDEWRTRAIAVLTLDPREGLTLALLRRLALDGAELKTLASFASLDRVLERVRSSDNGIAAIPLVPASGAGLRTLPYAATVKEAAHMPTPENLHDGSYPLCVPLQIVFRRESAPRLLGLLRYLLSDECGELLAREGFVPLPISVRNQLIFELEELN